MSVKLSWHRVATLAGGYWECREDPKYVCARRGYHDWAALHLNKHLGCYTTLAEAKHACLLDAEIRGGR